jgi:hypothetical protein
MYFWCSLVLSPTRCFFGEDLVLTPKDYLRADFTTCLIAPSKFTKTTPIFPMVHMYYLIASGQ